MAHERCGVHEMHGMVLCNSLGIRRDGRHVSRGDTWYVSGRCPIIRRVLYSSACLHEPFPSYRHACLTMNPSRPGPSTRDCMRQPDPHLRGDTQETRPQISGEMRNSGAVTLKVARNTPHLGQIGSITEIMK